MQDKCHLVLTHKPEEAHRQYLADQLSIYNAEQSHYMSAPDNAKEGLAVFLFDAQDTLVGGMIGSLVWHWLRLGVLWIEPGYRRQGYGTRLVQAAEAEAIRRACRYASVDTYSFQAPEFYMKLGYRINGQLKDFPPGHSYFYLVKELIL